MNDISNLLEIMKRLRDPQDGCPWDRLQTYRSIAPFTLEEAYEVVDAIERDGYDELPDELGDLLFQVAFYAQIAAEEGRFDFGDVVDAICTKMIRRHPHVFGDDVAASATEQTERWESIKRGERGTDQGLLDDVPPGLPGLTRAAKLGRRAASVGFDWPALPPVRAKIDEELAEADQAIADGDRNAVEAELGDVLFAVVNLCRHVAVDPEQALRGANARFAARFGHVERAVTASGGDWASFDAAGLDSLWHDAKRRERRGG